VTSRALALAAAQENSVHFTQRKDFTSAPPVLKEIAAKPIPHVGRVIDPEDRAGFVKAARRGCPGGDKPRPYRPARTSARLRTSASARLHCSASRAEVSFEATKSPAAA
jgi:hypothetical protein